MTEPIDSQFSWVNQGTATINTTKGGIYFDTGTPASGDNWHIRTKAAPATPYVITVGILFNVMSLPFVFTGVGWRDSAGGKLTVLSLTLHTGNDPGFTYLIYKWNSPTSFNSSYSVLGSSLLKAYGAGQSIVWMRITDNGTNRTAAVSNDGQNFTTIFTIGRTDFHTPDQVFFGANSNNANYSIGMNILSWKEN
jgi:hypothetical protein